MSVPAADAKKMSLPIRIIAGIIGLIAVAGGISQVRRGASELSGGTSKTVTTHLTK